MTRLFSVKAKKAFHDMDCRRVSYICTKCNKTISDYPTIKFCPYCGRRAKYE